jgi:hypothetical protein
VDNNTGRNWFGNLLGGKDAVIGDGGAYQESEAMKR